MNRFNKLNYSQAMEKKAELEGELARARSEGESQGIIQEILDDLDCIMHTLILEHGYLDTVQELEGS